MNPYDQQVYDAGFKYIPQSKYLLNPFTIPTAPQNPDAPQGGVPSVNMGGGNQSLYTGGITDLMGNFKDTVNARTQRLEDAYNNPSTAKIFGFPAFKQDVNPADAGFYVGEDMRIPQQRTALGKMFQPQSPQEIMEEGYKPRTNIGILSAILGKFDKFGTLPRPDQAFITSQMGYTGPTVFGENTGNQDVFGINTRSAFGNYAERVGKEVDKLGLALSPTGAIGGKKDFQGATFNPATGMFEADEDSDLTKEQIEALNKRTKLVRTKLNFYRDQKKERDDYREQQAQKIRDEMAAAAAAKSRAAARAAIKKQGEASYTPSIHGGTDYGRDSRGNQSFDFGGGFGIGSDGGPVSNRTGRGRTGFMDGGRIYYMDGGLADLVDIYD
jgi:hypothetical protein